LTKHGCSDLKLANVFVQNVRVNFGEFTRGLFSPAGPLQAESDLGRCTS